MCISHVDHCAHVYNVPRSYLVTTVNSSAYTNCVNQAALMLISVLIIVRWEFARLQYALTAWNHLCIAVAVLYIAARIGLIVIIDC